MMKTSKIQSQVKQFTERLEGRLKNNFEQTVKNASNNAKFLIQHLGFKKRLDTLDENKHELKNLVDDLNHLYPSLLWENGHPGPFETIDKTKGKIQLLLKNVDMQLEGTNAPLIIAQSLLEENKPNLSLATTYLKKHLQSFPRELNTYLTVVNKCIAELQKQKSYSILAELYTDIAMAYLEQREDELAAAAYLEAAKYGEKTISPQSQIVISNYANASQLFYKASTSEHLKAKKAQLFEQVALCSEKLNNKEAAADYYAKAAENYGSGYKNEDKVKQSHLMAAAAYEDIKSYAKSGYHYVQAVKNDYSEEKDEYLEHAANQYIKAASNENLQSNEVIALKISAAEAYLNISIDYKSNTSVKPELTKKGAELFSELSKLQPNLADQAQMLKKAGECYRLIGAHANAEQAYSAAVQLSRQAGDDEKLTAELFIMAYKSAVATGEPSIVKRCWINLLSSSANKVSNDVTLPVDWIKQLETSEVIVDEAGVVKVFVNNIHSQHFGELIPQFAQIQSDGDTMAMLKYIKLQGKNGKEEYYYTSAGDNSNMGGVLVPFRELAGATGIRVEKPHFTNMSVNSYYEDPESQQQYAQKFIETFSPEVVKQWLRTVVPDAEEELNVKNLDASDPENKGLQAIIIKYCQIDPKYQKTNPICALARFENKEKLALSIAHGTGWPTQDRKTEEGPFVKEAFVTWFIKNHNPEIAQANLKIQEHNGIMQQASTTMLDLRGMTWQKVNSDIITELTNSFPENAK